MGLRSSSGAVVSQLVRAITAADTGNVKLIDDRKFSPLFRAVFDAKATISSTYDPNMYSAKVYKIGVTLGSSVMVTELDAIQDKSGTALTQAIDRTKRQIIEAVFGEFRADFMMIERALYDHDFQKARLLLVQLEDKMFSTEV